MLSIRKINPMARAIGTMGVVAALVGAVTFAAQTNTVALTDNELTSGTPLLQIKSTGSSFANSDAGLKATLTPGQPKVFNFKLKNNDSASLTITASVPTDVSGSTVPASDITLTLNCGAGDVTYPLSSWAGGSAAIPGTIGAGLTASCTQTVTLISTYDQSGQTVTPYNINFVGSE